MNERTQPRGIVTRLELVLLAAAILALAVLSVWYTASGKQQPFASAEVQFTDASAHGLSIVPASCPSSPSYPGECGPVATPITFGDFTATLPASSGGSGSSDSGGTTFAASGHLEAQPTLLRAGNTTQLYWNVEDAKDCTVTGSNGDTWTADSSGVSGQVSGKIALQTVYTLTCRGLNGSATPVINESVTVDTVPTFQEQ